MLLPDRSLPLVEGLLEVFQLNPMEIQQEIQTKSRILHHYLSIQPLDEKSDKCFMGLKFKATISTNYKASYKRRKGLNVMACVTLSRGKQVLRQLTDYLWNSTGSKITADRMPTSSIPLELAIFFENPTEVTLALS